jgi:hypothetical protein
MVLGSPGCPALISLRHCHHPAPHHWWLADGGFPQRFAALLAAPLQRTQRRADSLDDWLEVFAPLPLLRRANDPPGGQPASYRYLIQLRPGNTALSCWRRDPEGIGWRRRCGPLPLEQFVQRFSAGSRGASS